MTDELKKLILKMFYKELRTPSEIATILELDIMDVNPVIFPRGKQEEKDGDRSQADTTGR